LRANQPPPTRPTTGGGTLHALPLHAGGPEIEAAAEAAATAAAAGAGILPKKPKLTPQEESDAAEYRRLFAS